MFGEYPKDEIEAYDIRALKDLNDKSLMDLADSVINAEFPNEVLSKVTVSTLMRHIGFLTSQLNKYHHMVTPVLERISQGKNTLRVDDATHVGLWFRARVDEDITYQRKLKEEFDSIQSDCD